MSELTPLRLVWLALTVIGAGLALTQGAGDMAQPIVAQLTLALWCLTETTLRRNWWALATLPVLLLLGLGAALPLYLFIRSRRIA